MAMVVVLPGTESDAAAGRIAALMRERTGVSLFTRGECAASPGAELIVAASHPGQRIELGEGCILVCLEPCGQTVLARRAHLLIAEGLPVPPGILTAQVISMGRGSKNTVTVSSVQGERAMISLQRTVAALDGESVEPCEMALDLPDEASLPDALAAAAALLLCGAAPQ